MLKNKGSLLIETLLCLQIYLLTLYIISHLYNLYIGELNEISIVYTNIILEEGDFILEQFY